MRKAAASILAYSLSWEPPASPNGIIRFYKVCWPHGMGVRVCGEVEEIEESGVVSEERPFIVVERRNWVTCCDISIVTVLFCCAGLFQQL